MVIQATGNSYFSKFPYFLLNVSFFCFFGMLWHALACLRKEGGRKEGRADRRKEGKPEGKPEGRTGSRKGGREAGRADGKPEGGREICSIGNNRDLPN